MARHAVLGAGGVGGLIAAGLARYGDTVTLVVRSAALQQHPRELKLESALGNFSVPVELGTEVDGPYDVLWITVKATQLEEALRSVKSVDQVRAVVPLLNGIDHVELLRSRFGRDRVVPATISVESERVAPGHIIHRSPFARLNVASAGRALLGDSVEKLATFGLDCKFVDNEATLLWSKLVFLAPIALSTSAQAAPIGVVRDDPASRARFHATIREACEVALASGASVDAEAVIAMVSGLPHEMRSSMQKDVAANRPPELDAIAGPIIRGGEVNDIGTPVSRELVAMIEDRIRRAA